MDILSIIGLFVIVYYCIYIACALTLDCDILLAVKEKFGKPISSLKGKTVWITGASSGIGEELACVLAKVGCKLVLSARRVDELERVKRKCLTENKGLSDEDVYVYALDMLDIDSHERAFQDVLKKFGKLDILVNNAGRSQRAQWVNVEIAVDKELFELDLFSVISLSRIAVRHFLKVGEGHVVVTSSLAGILPVPLSGSYSGAKHALHGYFKSLIIEHIDKNLDVTLVCPGPVVTNFLAECFTEKSGQKFGEEIIVTNEKMTGERCAVLMASAIANKLNEVWICKPPLLRLTYLYYCFPNMLKCIIEWLGPRYIEKLRDSKSSEEGR